MRGEIALSMNVIGKLDNTVIDAMGIMQKQDNDISIDMGEYVLKLLDIDVHTPGSDPIKKK